MGEADRHESIRCSFQQIRERFALIELQQINMEAHLHLLEHGATPLRITGIDGLVALFQARDPSAPYDYADSMLK